MAPHATATIKWGTPFFIDPRFLFAFSAAKTHCNFAPTAEVLAAFRKELAPFRTTANFLQLPYDRPLPEPLIRRIAKYRLTHREEGEGFW